MIIGIEKGVRRTGSVPFEPCVQVDQQLFISQHGTGTKK
jgi:hypothetical protein